MSTTTYYNSIISVSTAFTITMSTNGKQKQCIHTILDIYLDSNAKAVPNSIESLPIIVVMACVLLGLLVVICILSATLLLRKKYHINSWYMQLIFIFMGIEYFNTGDQEVQEMTMTHQYNYESNPSYSSNIMSQVPLVVAPATPAIPSPPTIPLPDIPVAASASTDDAAEYDDIKIYSQIV